MAALLLKNRALALTPGGRFLVTSAGGAPCCCGGTPPACCTFGPDSPCVFPGGGGVLWCCGNPLLFYFSGSSLLQRTGQPDKSASGSAQFRVSVIGDPPHCEFLVEVLSWNFSGTCGPIPPEAITACNFLSPWCAIPPVQAMFAMDGVASYACSAPPGQCLSEISGLLFPPTAFTPGNCSGNINTPPVYTASWASGVTPAGGSMSWTASLRTGQNETTTARQSATWATFALEPCEAEGCTPVGTPPRQRGACCRPDLSCFMGTRGQCATASGAYQGDGTTCETAPCPQPPIWACCKPDHTCALVTQAQCDLLQGQWHVNQTCGQVNCAQPVLGGCCVGASCTLLTSSDCLAQGGLWKGPNTDCQGQQPCAGACCERCFDPSLHICVDNVLFDQCQQNGGIWYDFGSTCGQHPECNPVFCAPIGGTIRGATGSETMRFGKGCAGCGSKDLL